MDDGFSFQNRGLYVAAGAPQTTWTKKRYETGPVCWEKFSVPQNSQPGNPTCFWYGSMNG